jgi:hypothetical protein
MSEDSLQVWIAKGSPVGESSWARVVGRSKEYDVFGVEYFVPRLLRGGPIDKDPEALIAYYKVIAFPEGGKWPISNLPARQVCE